MSFWLENRREVDFVRKLNYGDTNFNSKVSPGKQHDNITAAGIKVSVPIIMASVPPGLRAGAIFRKKRVGSSNAL